MNTIQFNKFSHFHNGENVIFTHMNRLGLVLKEISIKKHNVILISGNSDHYVQQNIFPKNIIKWFAQNALVDDDRIIPLPLGIESAVPCKINNMQHGIVWPHAIPKEKIIQRYIGLQQQPTKFIYANFNINTNIYERVPVRNICQEMSFITWGEYGQEYEHFLQQILEHEAVVCAQGNGPGDNHRIYETLYLGRIPITFNRRMYEKLWFNFPILLLENYNDLRNEELLKSKIREKQNQPFDREKLTYNYWANIVQKEIDKL